MIVAKKRKLALKELELSRSNLISNYFMVFSKCWIG